MFLDASECLYLFSKGNKTCKMLSESISWRWGWGDKWERLFMCSKRATIFHFLLTQALQLAHQASQSEISSNLQPPNRKGTYRNLQCGGWVCSKIEEKLMVIVSSHALKLVMTRFILPATRGCWLIKLNTPWSSVNLGSHLLQTVGTLWIPTLRYSNLKSEEYSRLMLHCADQLLLQQAIALHGSIEGHIENSCRTANRVGFPHLHFLLLFMVDEWARYGVGSACNCSNDDPPNPTHVNPPPASTTVAAHAAADPCLRGARSASPVSRWSPQCQCSEETIGVYFMSLERLLRTATKVTEASTTQFYLVLVFWRAVQLVETMCTVEQFGIKLGSDYHIREIMPMAMFSLKWLREFALQDSRVLTRAPFWNRPWRISQFFFWPVTDLNEMNLNDLLPCLTAVHFHFWLILELSPEG